jgi:hypothetical protein
VEDRSVVVRIVSEFSLFFFCMGSYEELCGREAKKDSSSSRSWNLPCLFCKRRSRPYIGLLFRGGVLWPTSR